MIDENLLSPCGLYCGVCGIRMAYLSGNLKFIAVMAAAYSVDQNDIKCEGCLSKNQFVLCKTCPIKSCTQEKSLDGCHRCPDWPCNIVEEFSFEAARSQIKRAIPLWSQLGTEKWIEHEMKWFSCKNCGAQLFRGARRCRSCGVDWTD